MAALQPRDAAVTNQPEVVHWLKCYHDGSEEFESESEDPWTGSERESDSNTESSDSDTENESKSDSKRDSESDCESGSDSESEDGEVPVNKKKRLMLNHSNNDNNSTSIIKNNKNVLQSCELYFLQPTECEIQSFHNKSDKYNNNLLFPRKQCNLLINGYCRQNSLIVKDLINIIDKYYGDGSKITFNVKGLTDHLIFLDLNGVSMRTGNNNNNNNNSNKPISISLKLKESNCKHREYGRGSFWTKLSLIGFKTNSINTATGGDQYLTKEDFFAAIHSSQGNESGIEIVEPTDIFQRDEFVANGFNLQKYKQCKYHSFHFRKVPLCPGWPVDRSSMGFRYLNNTEAYEHLRSLGTDWEKFRDMKWGDTINLKIDNKNRQIICTSDCNNDIKIGKLGNNMEYFVCVLVRGCECSNIENGRCFELIIND